MMSPQEREAALASMSAAVSQFYCAAVRIGVHPFIEFAGVMGEYVNMCRDAHHSGIDFSHCSVHTGLPLPMKGYQVSYLAEKLDCIFCGRITATHESAPQT